MGEERLREEGSDTWGSQWQRRLHSWCIRTVDEGIPLAVCVSAAHGKISAELHLPPIGVDEELAVFTKVVDELGLVAHIVKLGEEGFETTTYVLRREVPVVAWI